MSVPYLFRFIRLARAVSGASLTYDEKLQLNVVSHDIDRTPAVLRNDIAALATKKADVEKGEDQKDKWPSRKSSL